jgi:hypothetical protein
MTDTGACGTYAGFQRHKRIPEDPCEACRIAAGDYVRHYRATHPAAMVRHREVTRARFRAMTRLSHNHAEEYRTLYAAELATTRGTFEPSCPCWEPGDGPQCSTCGEVQE